MDSLQLQDSGYQNSKFIAAIYSAFIDRACPLQPWWISDPIILSICRLVIALGIIRFQQDGYEPFSINSYRYNFCLLNLMVFIQLCIKIILFIVMHCPSHSSHFICKCAHCLVEWHFFSQVLISTQATLPPFINWVLK